MDKEKLASLIPSQPDISRDDLDRAARDALERIIKELQSGGGEEIPDSAAIAGIARAMGYTESMLRQLRAGGTWPARAIAALAEATGQQPGQMLAREENQTESEETKCPSSKRS